MREGEFVFSRGADWKGRKKGMIVFIELLFLYFIVMSWQTVIFIGGNGIAKIEILVVLLTTTHLWWYSVIEPPVGQLI